MTDFVLQLVRGSAAGIKGYELIMPAVMNFNLRPGTVQQVVDALEGDGTIYKDASGMYRPL